jgi:hypothetical protein
MFIKIVKLKLARPKERATIILLVAQCLVTLLLVSRFGLVVQCTCKDP